jgi:hypothetical protein
VTDTDTCGSRYRDAANVHDCYLPAGHPGKHRASADPDSLVWLPRPKPAPAPMDPVHILGIKAAPAADDAQAATDAQTARLDRRNTIHNLISRTQRGRMLTSLEADMLAATVQAEMEDADEAHEAFANVMQQRDADCAAYNATVNAALRETDGRRRALADALGAFDTTGWDRLIRSAEQTRAGRRTWREKAEAIEADRDRLAAELAEVQQTLSNSETLGHRLLQRAEAAEAAAVADERRADRAEADRTAGHRAIEALMRVEREQQQRDRAERAEAALARVREQCADWLKPAAYAPRSHDGRITDEVTRTCADIIERAARLDGDQPAEAANPLYGQCAGCRQATIRVDPRGRFLCQTCDSIEQVDGHRQAEAPTVALNGDQPAEAQPDAEPTPSPTPELTAAIRAYMAVATPLVIHLARTLGITPQEPQ